MSIAVSLLLGVAVVVLITAATAYFVAQEFAYMAVDRSQLQAAADRGDHQAKRTLVITRRTSFMLSGAQLGITVTGLLVGYVAEPLIGDSLAALIGGVGSGVVSTGAALAVGGVLALVFSTLVQMLLGELFPKNLAIARPDQVARALSGSTRWYLRLLGPLIWVFDKSAERLLQFLRIDPVHDVEHSATAHDLEAVVEESMESGNLTRDLSVILDRILDFPRHDVDHAMRPRGRVDVVPPDLRLGEVRALMATGHTRYPVVDPTDDTIVGVVHLQDLLPRQDLETHVREVARPAVVVHELMDLPDALAALLRADDELACVVDEYGMFSGILTVEDLAEEIVGDLTDEHDDVVPADLITTDGDGWLTAGDIHTDEIERALQIDLPPGPYETVSGMVVDHNRELPAVGDLVLITLPPTSEDLVDDDRPVLRALAAEVLEIDRHVPVRLRLTLTEAPEEEQP